MDDMAGTSFSGSMPKTDDHQRVPGNAFPATISATAGGANRTAQGRVLALLVGGGVVVVVVVDPAAVTRTDGQVREQGSRGVGGPSRGVDLPVPGVVGEEAGLDKGDVEITAPAGCHQESPIGVNAPSRRTFARVGLLASTLRGQRCGVAGVRGEVGFLRERAVGLCQWVLTYQTITMRAITASTTRTNLDSERRLVRDDRA
jgi:hypothetical protein